MTEPPSRTSGFEHPLELWEACHERVRRMNELLVRLVGHIREHGIDEQARVTAQSIRRYFTEASPLHHMDEERDLFPCLLAHTAARPPSIAAERVAGAIATLEAEHQEIRQMWMELAPMLQDVEQGDASRLDDALVAAFVSRYRAHLALEEEVIGPALKRQLSQKDLARIGIAMAGRRGLTPRDLEHR